MEKFRCRTVKPKQSHWKEVSADSFPEAAEAFFFQGCDHGLEVVSVKSPIGEIVKFALVEVEGHGELVARVFHHGIWRRGVPRPYPTLKQVAAILGWEHDPEELLGSGWDCEETKEEAEERKFGRNGKTDPHADGYEDHGTVQKVAAG